MNKAQELKKLNVVTKRIIRDYKPDKIILFGSYAWGRPTKDSDFDLCIVKNVGQGKRAFFAEHRKVHTIIDGEIAVDVLIFSQARLQKRLAMGDFFVGDIVSKGRVLYGKQ